MGTAVERDGAKGLLHTSLWIPIECAVRRTPQFSHGFVPGRWAIRPEGEDGCPELDPASGVTIVFPGLPRGEAGVNMSGCYGTNKK